MTDLSLRVPLRWPTASSTFIIGIAGYLGVNLSPYMITALREELELDTLTASWIVTATLLATAVAGLAIAPLCAGPRRLAVARVGLGLGAIGFGAAALGGIGALVIAGLFIGGLGAGGAVAASGAALAAFRNPDRAAGFYGLANRGVITIVLAIVPLMGLAAIDVFGTLAVFSLLGLAASRWLPAAPMSDDRGPAAPAEAMPIEIPRTGTLRVRRPAEARAAWAGFGILVVFALWAASEDSLWAMAGVMGGDRTGLTAEGLGVALSGATAGGLLGSVGLMIAGNRFGRVIPLTVLLVTGGALKIALGFVTDPTLFIAVFIIWNTVYAMSFMFFVATASALDETGRWSGPLMAVYLVGSALTPVIGAAIVSIAGYVGFVTVLAVASFALAIPAAAIARVSQRVDSRTALVRDTEVAA
ncbi:MFS transporter [Microbacterium arborescens]